MHDVRSDAANGRVGSTRSCGPWTGLIDAEAKQATEQVPLRRAFSACRRLRGSVRDDASWRRCVVLDGSYGIKDSGLSFPRFAAFVRDSGALAGHPRQHWFSGMAVVSRLRAE